MYDITENPADTSVLANELYRKMDKSHLYDDTILTHSLSEWAVAYFYLVILVIAL